ncbi:hypothetical protein [Sinorhizobium meliloti]|uniref:hypothetical protein n=1 Tax=Rhizobium meliloti TaxID=382 RepID=UPI003B517D21
MTPASIRHCPKSAEPVIVIAPFVKEIAIKLAAKVKVVKLNTDENPELAVQCGVSSAACHGSRVVKSLSPTLTAEPAHSAPGFGRLWRVSGLERRSRKARLGHDFSFRLNQMGHPLFALLALPRRLEGPGVHPQTETRKIADSFLQQRELGHGRMAKSY